MLAPFQSEQDAILQMLKLMEQRNEDEFMKAFSVYTQKTSDSKNSVYSYFFVCSFLRACVDQKEILLESAIKTVLESGFCSYQACPELLSFLLERKAIDLLELYFLHVSDIPESQIVDLLNFAVNQDNDAFLLEYFSQHWSVARKKLQPPYEKPGDVLLALAFSSARNDNFLLSALKKIPIESTLKLLRFAVCWIRRYASNEERVAKKLTAALRAPSYLQVLDWLAVLLDSHLPRLVLFAETRQCLLEIAGVVTCELKILAGLLERVIGTLLGHKLENEVTVTKCFMVPHSETEHEVAVNMEFQTKFYELHKKVNPKEVIVGWFASGDKINDYSLLIHEFYTNLCCDPVHLTIDVMLTNGDMSIKSYQTMKFGQLNSESNVGTAFYSLDTTVIYAENEAIAVDMMQKNTDTVNPFSIMTDKNHLKSALSELLKLITRVTTYVKRALDGEIPSDKQISHILWDIISTIPDVDTETFDKLFNNNLHDMLMVMFLTNLTRTQLKIADRLYIAL
ncbi:uncharacterized protein LOC135119762 [Zophobas morio]|uniref:uncharacterized protein LOC135119762 n=1 Tax=Zophobas morio TaxID=2755281 RepID=UPI003082AFBD